MIHETTERRPKAAARICSAPALARRCRLLLIVAFTVLASHAGSALAQPESITNVELKLLPEYCADTQTFNGYGMQPYNWSPNAPKWLSLMGQGFWSMHHYCWALIRLGRIKMSTPPVIQKGLRQAALSDLGFVVQNSPPDFVMLPEIYTKIGEVELGLRKESDAQQAFEQARALKPDYWPAYSLWAQHLMIIGRRADARSVVEAGLAHAPNSKTLQSMYRDLGGDPAAVKQAPPPAQREPPR